MTPQQIEALKLALEALEGLKSLYGGKGHKLHEINMIHRNHDTAITVLKKALAEHAMRETQRLGQEIEQEPCVHAKNPKGCYRIRCQLGDKCVDDEMSFRTTPPQRTWVNLTDEDRNDCLVEADPCECLATPEAQELMRCVEDKSRSKNQ